MNGKTRKIQKPRQKFALANLVSKSTLTQEDKTKIKQTITSRVNYLDELLEEQIETILFGDGDLKLAHEKRKESILLAKQIYFQG
jgi:hypothetical protein